MPEPEDYYTRFAETLDGLGARWVLIGALAAAKYRLTPRFTTDADFLVLPVTGVTEAFEAQGFEVRSMAEPGQQPYVFFVRAMSMRADILVAETDYQRLAVERGTEGWLTVEDVLVHKLIAWRPRDQDDVRSILAAGHEVDQEYVERWAGVWHVLDRWTEAQRWPG